MAVAAGYNPKKLAQKLGPLESLPELARVDLFCRRPFELGEKIRWAPVPGFCRRGVAPGELWKFFSLMRRAPEYDVLCGLFQQFHGFWAHLAGKARSRPVIQAVMTDPAWNMARPVPRAAMLGADACLVRGPISAGRLREYGYAGHVGVLHNAFVPAAPPAVEKRYDFIAVGNFAAEKDYPFMLEVLGLLRRSRPEPSVLLVGGGLAENLEKIAQTYTLSETLTFAGRLAGEDLDAAYAASRALLLTSSVEGLPMVALEAMALGLPVACAAVGEMPWLVRDGREGRLAPHGDVQAMVRAARDVLEDADGGGAMGRAARGRFEELAPLFTPEAVAGVWRRAFVALGLL